MNIVVISDIHGDIENMLSYLDKIKELNFDVIVCPGDFTDINVPYGFTQEEIARLIIGELKSVKKPVLSVPGNMDTKDMIKIFEEEGVSIHGKGKIIKGVGFYGYGGAKTPFGTNIEPGEEEMKLGLQNSWEEVKECKYKVQITHAPPHNTRMDIIQSGIHVGSTAVREFIEKYQPILAVSAHIHEAKGIDYLKNTFLINSGRFPEGYFGFVSIENNKVNGKVLNLIE
jgi:hypothetical protein